MLLTSTLLFAMKETETNLLLAAKSANQNKNNLKIELTNGNKEHEDDGSTVDMRLIQNNQNKTQDGN